MRRVLVGLVLGITIGVAIAFAIPDLLYERRTVSLANGIEWEDIEQATIRDGWRIVRIDDKALYQLERPRLRLPAGEIGRVPAPGPMAAPKSAPAAPR